MTGEAMSKSINTLHHTADQLGRLSGAYIPAVAAIEIGLREIVRLQKLVDTVQHLAKPLQRDAERYRWLRNAHVTLIEHSSSGMLDHYDGDEFDQCVDAAMAAEAAQGGADV